MNNDIKEKNKCNLCKKNVTVYGLLCRCKNLYCYKCLDSYNNLLYNVYVFYYI